MNAIDDQKRKDAIRGLINIAILEGFVLMLVVAVFLTTNNTIYLIGGIMGSTLIFAPMILRWSKAHGASMKAKPNSDHNED